MWLGKLTALDMILLGWLGCKTSTQTNTHFLFSEKIRSLQADLEKAAEKDKANNIEIQRLKDEIHILEKVN